MFHGNTNGGPNGVTQSYRETGLNCAQPLGALNETPVEAPRQSAAGRGAIP